jgi:hypothetical protein
MVNYNLKYIQVFIAKLLHPDNNSDLLKPYFPASQVFWDRVVKVSSAHLIIPAVGEAFKRKKLESYLPNKLMQYLEEISSLNQTRNLRILEQIDFIAGLFEKNKIEYVFLKGAAMLILKPYNTVRERMVGDIDILVSNKDLYRANALLINEGFFERFYNKVKLTKNIAENKHKHLSALNHSDYIASVELHRSVLDHKYTKYLPSQLILSTSLFLNKRHRIPSQESMWKLTILNWQYNDNGLKLNSLAWRPVLDVLFLEPKVALDNQLKVRGEAIKHFYSLLAVFYHHYPVHYLICKQFFLWQLRFNKLQIAIKYFVKFNLLSQRILKHLLLFMKSNAYRKKLIYNIKDIVPKIKDFWDVH